MDNPAMREPQRPDEPFAPAASPLPPDPVSGVPDGELLLRPQALKHAADGAFGRPIAHLPISWLWAFAGTMVLIAVAVVALSLQSFERIAVAQGALRPVGGEASVYAAPGLVIEQILVGEGQAVAKGQPLAVLSNEVASRGGESLSATLLASLDQQVALLERQLATLGRDVAARQMETSAAEAELRANLAAAEASQNEANIRLGMAEEDLAIAEPVAKRGFVSRNAMRQRQIAVVNMRQLAREERGRVEGLRFQLARQAATATRLPLSQTSEELTISSQLEELRQRREQVRIGSLREVRAPVAGHVSALQASVGRTTVPTQPLLYIVPDKARLEAVLYIPSRNIGFVRAGQHVRLRYHAYPYQRYGAFDATVRHVSRTVIRPEEITGPLSINEPVYRVVASIARESVKGYGRTQPLSAGLVFDADIVLEDRSFLDWITDPFRALKGNA